MSSSGQGIPGVPNFQASGCVGPQSSPCSPCLPPSFHLSVWLSYEPVFQFLIGALYGPLPLLIVLLDIHRGMSLKRSSLNLINRETVRMRNPTTFKHFMPSSLFEHYFNDSQAGSHLDNSQSSACDVRMTSIPESSTARASSEQ
jgi:hypothetical protein